MTAYKGCFRTLYRLSPDPRAEVIENKFDTRQENDEFADAIILIGAHGIEKEWFSLSIHEWYRYHKKQGKT